MARLAGQEDVAGPEAASVAAASIPRDDGESFDGCWLWGEGGEVVATIHGDEIR
eukprot:CAMPEP_0180791986 /NCGR_PEP_ID=MMETSP1038_2-20121128/54136_1 /TAXON_ID=632150 /ORGANISM="Azadinium spinosum, Strain 3D9" /LENGTH=53 /DNA_ID=CAMNT_0022830231 /DNA_START=57 /DNA_END=214 /DNA_ORIENTATION=-